MLSQNQMVKVKKALEKGYIGTMDVYEYVQTTDAVTHVTSASLQKVLEQVPCRLSFTNSPQTAVEGVASISQVTMLFFDNVYSIKAGSKIDVTQNGITESYKHSGTEAAYDTHKEVVVELCERWA